MVKSVPPCLRRALIFLKQAPSHSRFNLCCLISSATSGWSLSRNSLRWHGTTCAMSTKNIKDIVFCCFSCCQFIIVSNGYRNTRLKLQCAQAHQHWQLKTGKRPCSDSWCKTWCLLLFQCVVRFSPPVWLTQSGHSLLISSINNARSQNCRSPFLLYHSVKYLNQQPRYSCVRSEHYLKTLT